MTAVQRAPYIGFNWQLRTRRHGSLVVGDVAEALEAVEAARKHPRTSRWVIWPSEAMRGDGSWLRWHAPRMGGSPTRAHSDVDAFAVSA